VEESYRAALNDLLHTEPANVEKLGETGTTSVKIVVGVHEHVHKYLVQQEGESEWKHIEQYALQVPLRERLEILEWAKNHWNGLQAKLYTIYHLSDALCTYITENDEQPEYNTCEQWLLQNYNGDELTIEQQTQLYEAAVPTNDLPFVAFLILLELQSLHNCTPPFSSSFSLILITVQQNGLHGRDSDTRPK
jgi:hypothetical protein